MKLKHYIVKLEVNFAPTLGNFGGDTFIAEDGTVEFTTEYGVNAVCLN
jgi:hypothetical protein